MAFATVTVRRLAVVILDAIAKRIAVLAEPRSIFKHVVNLTMQLLPDLFGLGFHVLDAWRHHRPRHRYGSNDSAEQKLRLVCDRSIIHLFHWFLVMTGAGLPRSNS